MSGTEFAGFASSLSAAGIPAQDSFSPAIIDLIARRRVKLLRHREKA